MTIEELDHRIRRFSTAVQEMAETLLELELDPTRELLENSKRAGATASAWTPVSTALGRAWEARTLLEAHLERVRELRGRKPRLSRERLLELDELLERPMLAVPGEPGARDSCQALLKRSSAAIADAQQLIAMVSKTWDALVPRLTTANATLRASGELLEQLGADPGPGFADARRELQRLTDTVAGDPLSAAPEPVAALEAAVAEVRADAERLRDLRSDTGARLAEARDLLTELRAAEADAHEAHRVAEEKIAGAELPKPATPPANLEEELDAIAGLLQSGAWREGADALRHWHLRATAARDQARGVAAANRAPIALRDELRGRLGAYQAKAQRLRLLEDPALAALHARAHRILHTAPTNLDEAGAVLRRYQEGLSLPPEHEVLR